MFKKKKIAIFTVLVVLFNFIMPNAMIVAQAESSNRVLDKITSIENDITKINTLIETWKISDNYLNDKSFKVATNYFEKSFISDNIKFIEIKDELSEGIKLSEIVSYEFDSDIVDLYSEYIENGNDPDLLINITSIEDITFTISSPVESGDDETKTLLSKENIESIIIDNYLDDISNKINSYNEAKLDSFKSSYEVIILEIDNEIDNLEAYINLVKEYEEKELLFDNNPNMDIDNTNIYTLFNDNNLLLEALKDKVDLSNTDDINSELLTIKDDIKNIYDKFILNNNDFTLLSNEITSLEDLYEDNINKLNDYLTLKEIAIDEIDISNIDNDFINITNEFDSLIDKYNSLIESINKYLLRRPSDGSLAEEKLESLNSYVLNYDYSTLLELLALNASLEDEVDILLNSKLLSEETLELLKLKKLEFYEIKLIDDSNYKIILKDNKMIIDIVKELDIDSLLNNISYTSNTFTYTKEENIHYITFYDKNDNVLIKYEVCLKNDLNNDYKLDNEDIKLLKELLLKEENDLLLTDFNNDGLLNIKDVTDLDNYINSIYLSNEEILSNFYIDKEEINNKITYKIYLKSNGIVNGFSFNVNVSNDLTFKEYLTSYDILLDNEINPSKIIGIGNFSNNDLILELVYELNTESTKTTFNLNNGIIVNNNGIANDNLSNLNIIGRVEQTEESSDKKASNNVINLDKTVEEDNKKEETDKKVTNVIIDDNIEISNDNPSISNIIKVVLVILLGVLLIYFLNKTDEYKDNKRTE